MALSNTQTLDTELNNAPWNESHPEMLTSLWVPLHLQVSIQRQWKWQGQRGEELNTLPNRSLALRVAEEPYCTMPLKHPFAWRKVKSPPLHFSSSAHQSYSHLFTLWDFNEGRFVQRIMLSRQRPPKHAYLIEIQTFPKGKNFSRRRVLNLLMI